MGGASTLTQQLAKQLFHGEGLNSFLSYRSKKKNGLSPSVWKDNTPKRNHCDVLQRLWFRKQFRRVSSAAKPISPKLQRFDYRRIGYFGRECLKLWSYNPIRNPEGVKPPKCGFTPNGKRKNHYRTTKLQLQSLPIKLNFKLETHKDGIATYFREYLRDYMKKW